MPPPINSSYNTHGGKGSNESQSLANNLWVGNLSAEVTDSDLMILFSKYGTVDSITSYLARSYAFVVFKRVEDAKAALQALHGTYLRGNSLKIHFAKQAKPCKSLWVSGISPSVKKEVLEAEFLKFGEIEEFKFLRDRNTAYVDYFRLEDASQALKVMNGKQIGGDRIHVDFLRPQTIRREHGADYRDAREGQFFIPNMGPPDSSWMLQDMVANYSGHIHPGFKQQQHAQFFGGQKDDGQPSNILWIGYPPSVHVEEQMLHNALILFGEIERIRSFPSRYCSFVEFRSVDEARRAKEGLQGRLFNDPRISIRYSSSEIALSKDYPGFYPGIQGSRPRLRPDMLFSEPFFERALMDIHNRPIVPNAFFGPAPPRGILGSNIERRPFSPHGSFDPLLSGPGFNDLTAHKFPHAIPSSMMGGPNWKRPQPVPGMPPPPSQGAGLIKPVSGMENVFDANQFQRESKRSRIDNVPVYDAPFPSRKMNDHDVGLNRLYPYGPAVDGGVLGSVQEKNVFSPAEARMITRGTGQGHLDHNYIWRGVIAKGGTPVCRARCVALGKGIESEIPEVVNCSARTGLDLLTKHYAEASGCNVVFFLPDSEDDFTPYTEFLRYLGTKDRAGVAKFDDGTTLFLVPPSDFLSKVLQIADLPRLYGVVLKFPQHAPRSPFLLQPQFLQSQYPNAPEILPSNEYAGMHQKVEKAMHTEYESFPATNQLAPSTKDSIPMHPDTLVNAEAVSQSGFTLTPELIATLASLLPSGTKFSDPETTQPSLESSLLRPELGNGSGIGPQSWTHDHQGYEKMDRPVHQAENQYNSTGQQFQTYSNGLNTSNNSTVGLTFNSQVQFPAFHPPQVAGFSMPFTNFGIPAQSGQVTVIPQVDGQYQYEAHQSTQKGFEMAHGTGSVGSYGSSAYNEPANRAALLNNQAHETYVTEAHTAMPTLVDDKGNPELSNQVQQLHPALYEDSQGISDFDVDKDQRYQSTLQFAANLLLQIQQQQQQPTNTQTGQGSSNQ